MIFVFLILWIIILIYALDAVFALFLLLFYPVGESLLLDKKSILFVAFPKKSPMVFFGWWKRNNYSSQRNRNGSPEKFRSSIDKRVIHIFIFFRFTWYHSPGFYCHSYLFITNCSLFPSCSSCCFMSWLYFNSHS